MVKRGKKKGNVEQEPDTAPSAEAAGPSAIPEPSQQNAPSQSSRKGKNKFKAFNIDDIGKSVIPQQVSEKAVQAAPTLAMPTAPVQFVPAQAAVQPQAAQWGKKTTTPQTEVGVVSQSVTPQQQKAAQQPVPKPSEPSAAPPAPPQTAPWGKKANAPAAVQQPVQTPSQPSAAMQIQPPQTPAPPQTAPWGKKANAPAAVQQPVQTPSEPSAAMQFQPPQTPAPPQSNPWGKKATTPAAVQQPVQTPSEPSASMQFQPAQATVPAQSAPWANKATTPITPSVDALSHQLRAQSIEAQRSSPALDHAPSAGDSAPQQGQGKKNKNKKKGQAAQAEGSQTAADSTKPVGNIQQQEQLKQPQQQAPIQSEPPAMRQSPAKTGLTVPQLKKQPRKEKTGERIIVETNYLPISLNPKIKEVIHYDVAIEPDKPKKFLFPVVTMFLKKNFPKHNPAFDGQKNLYSVGLLPMKSNILCDTVLLPEEGRKEPLKFEVTVKLAARVDMSLLNTYMNTGVTDNIKRAIQCLDIVLRHSSHTRSGFVKVGRSFFTAPVPGAPLAVSLGGGLELWHGIYQSAVLGWKPFINVDITNKGFPKRQSVVSLIGELNDSRDNVLTSRQPLDRRIIDNLKKFIKTLKVEYEVPGMSATRRSYRVNDVVDSADRLKFKMDDGRMMTVADYFKTDRKYNLKFPHFPCLWVGSRNSERKIYYPVELCTVLPGQVIIRKMDGSQTTKMINETAGPANERQMKVRKAIENMKYNQDPIVKEFGINVTEKFQAVDARVIPAPDLEYCDKFIVKPREGMWRGGKFLTSAKLTNWIVLVLDRVQIPAVEAFVDMLMTGGRKAGMTIDRPKAILKIEQRQLDGEMMAAKQNNLQLVVAVIGSFGNDYAKVKQAAELKYGILTQCIKGNTVNRFKPTTADMILLKINAKLSQVNHKMNAASVPKCLNRPCMIVGADVTHPSPGQMNEPSIAAVAASHHRTVFPYNICLRLQPPKTEIILDFGEMIKEQLLFFHSKTTMKPAHIIIFRDGVSDGQFDMVLNSELMAIRRACSSVEPGYEPKVSFFVVQKRHHTRFFPTNRKDADRNGNVPPGTCIDTDITHPTEMDFYLLSHASIRGTARPTRYHCLWDDANMKESEVEELAYYLCHMFTRCNRAVSYPAPTYYAHLAAARAKVLVEGHTIDMDNLKNEQKKLNIVEGIIKQQPMFFV